MPNHYLIVYHATSDLPSLNDIGDDPCFDNPPSWGICRPNVRRWVTRGSNLFFLAFIQPAQYYLKGWFEVGEKISYVEAARRFPHRRNVIIRPLQNWQTMDSIKLKRKIMWRYPKKKKFFEQSQLTSIPNFLFSTISENTVFIQNPDDLHEIDNWKCNRLFQCTYMKFKKCISLNSCQKEGSIENEQYRHYVVANSKRWSDTGGLRIDWQTIDVNFNFGFSLQTPKGQHNTKVIPKEKIQPLLHFLNQRKMIVNKQNTD